MNGPFPLGTSLFTKRGLLLFVPPLYAWFSAFRLGEGGPRTVTLLAASAAVAFVGTKQPKTDRVAGDPTILGTPGSVGIVGAAPEIVSPRERLVSLSALSVTLASAALGPVGAWPLVGDLAALACALAAVRS